MAGLPAGQLIASISTSSSSWREEELSETKRKRHEELTRRTLKETEASREKISRII